MFLFVILILFKQLVFEYSPFFFVFGSLLQFVRFLPECLIADGEQPTEGAAKTAGEPEHFS